MRVIDTRAPIIMSSGTSLRFIAKFRRKYRRGLSPRVFRKFVFVPPQEVLAVILDGLRTRDVQ